MQLLEALDVNITYHYMDNRKIVDVISYKTNYLLT